MNAVIYEVREKGSKASGAGRRAFFTERCEAVGHAQLLATFGMALKVIRIDVGDEGRSETVVRSIKPNFTEEG